ncbi:MAG: hypothetical protein NXI24_10250 [bacterium]|nr:hypothetical protein [bacterium]
MSTELTVIDFAPPEDGRGVRHLICRESDSEQPPDPRKLAACLDACPDLEILWLSWDSSRNLQPEAKPGFEQILEMIQTGGSRLRALQISSNSLQDANAGMIHRDALPALTRLELPDCHRLGSKGVERIVAGCPGLTHLDLHYSLHDESNAAAHAIGQGLSKLRWLGMHRSCHVEDDGLIAIARGCPELQQAHMGRNYELSDAALRALADHCAQIELVGMYYNKGVTAEGLRYLSEHASNFRCFHHGRGWCQVRAIQAVEDEYPNICFAGNKSFCVERSYAAHDASS